MHSVVIPLYNKAAYVEHTLLSLARQLQPPHELIIVDDASTDGSLAIAQHTIERERDAFKHTRIEVVQLARNYGPGYARNRGFERTTGQLVSFLDADDMYTPDFLLHVHRAIEQFHIDFLVMGIRYVPSGFTDPDMTTLRSALTPLEADLFAMENPLEVVTTPAFVMGVGSNVVAKRAWMERVRFDEGVELNEGIDYWYRVLKHVVYCEGTTVALLLGEHLHVREVPNSLSRKKYRHWREIDYPPVLRRYKNSSDRYDKRLMRVIGARWLHHSLHNLSSVQQKILFVFHYWHFVARHGMRFLLR